MDAGRRGAMNMPVAGVACTAEMLCTIAQLWMKNNMDGRVWRDVLEEVRESTVSEKNYWQKKRASMIFRRP
jgi:hypothetical protein